jgi:hypothetical protein
MADVAALAARVALLLSVTMTSAPRPTASPAAVLKPP